MTHLPFTDENVLAESQKLKRRTYAALNQRFPKVDFQSVKSAADRLNLGLKTSIGRSSGPLPPRQAVPNPKPVKGAKGKKGEAE